MKIRAQHQIAVWTSALVAVCVFAILAVSTSELDRALAESGFAAQLNARGIAGLRTVTIEYMLHPGERPKIQWWDRHGSLEKDLDADRFDDPEEKALLAEIRRRHRYLGEIFPKLVAIKENEPPGMASASRDPEAQLVAQMLVATHDMSADVAQLMSHSHAELGEIQRRANVMVAGAVTLMALVVAAHLALAIRRIVVPLRVLQEGVERVGAGELAHRTSIPVDNEIGELSVAFDRMAANLSASRDQLARRTRDVEEANRELEAFSYSVSHDLRAPLRGIDGWSLALAEDWGDRLGGEARTQIGFIRSEAQRMGLLIDDILELSRVTRQPLERQALDIAPIARRVAARLQATYPQRRIEFRIADSMPAAGDPRLIEIALTNLLDNACKFSAGRDPAVVEVAPEPPAGADVPALPGIRIRDNGVGFDMAHASRLFGAFQRLHRAEEFPGTGIGLATVQRIVRRHGGRLWAEARPGEGATFRFTLENGT